jgi:GT2 family glycosyltransferase
MTSEGTPSWPAARWVGLLDVAPPPDVATLALPDAAAYSRARLLVRDRGQVRGFVELGIRDGELDAAAVRAAIEALPPASSLYPQSKPDRPGPDQSGPDLSEPDQGGLTAQVPSVSIVLCTRNRPQSVRMALESVLAIDYPALEILVVDNAADPRPLEAVVAGIADPRLRHVHEPTPGLSRARNTGLRHAAGQFVAFTDDDVVVDRAWIEHIVRAFGVAPDVACVTGLVPSGELRTPVQAHFDQRVSWASSCRPRLFRLADPPPDVPMFPFQVGCYGTGANFALRRSVAFTLGGFDEALGAGSATGGGEDIDMFVRVVHAGYALAYEPSAIVWHRHRADVDALHQQAIGYGLGLGAWLTKVALDRRLAPLAVRRSGAAVRRIVGLGRGTGADARPAAPAAVLEPDRELRELLARVARAERRAVLRGPLRYRAARRSGAAAPLVSHSGGAAPLASHGAAAPVDHGAAAAVGPT